MLQAIEDYMFRYTYSVPDRVNAGGICKGLNVFG